MDGFRIRMNNAKKKKAPVHFHVHVPLYRFIPKELQTGWAQYDDHRLIAWDNTTDVVKFAAQFPPSIKLDFNLYCGTCGCQMVKGRRPDLSPQPTATLKLL